MHQIGVGSSDGGSMKVGVVSIVIMAFLSVGFQKEVPKDTKVEITLMSGTRISGEILSVRDSTIVVANQAGLPEGVLITERNRVAVLPHRRVMSVESPGTSRTFVMGVGGMAMGCMVGCLIGSGQKVERQPNDTFGCSEQAEREKNAENGALVGGLAGCLVGGALGAGISTKDTSFISSSQRDFKVLRAIARYPDIEPEFLKKIAP